MDALRSKCSGGKTPLRLAAWMFVVVLGACAGSSADDATATSSENLGTPNVDIEMSAEELGPVYSTWINQLGLVQDDPIIWHTRLVEACTEGVWDREVALSLADRYLVEDASLTADPDGSSKGPSTEEAANALWTMAVQTCRERFPGAALEEGPPFMAVGVDVGFAPPDVCTAGEVPVEAANRPFVYLVCGRTYVDPMYPVPASWFGDGSGIEEVLGYLVGGTSGRAAELGLWAGFDALTRAERDGISVEVEVSGSGVATIRLLDSDGADWRPPSGLFASVADWVMFTDVIAATALDFDHVGAVVLNVCPSLGGETGCDPLQDTDMRMRHADWPIDSFACGLVDYWTKPECDPG